MNKEKYKKLCENETTIPIFSKDWWLDAVAGPENWDVILVEKGGEIKASMPYVIKKRYGFTFLSHPPLTQNLGPWIKPSMAKYSKLLSQQKFLMGELIKQLPKYDYFSHNWHYSYTNWLPFYWSGFKQTTRYTYVIDDLRDLNNVYANFSSGKRKDINKAIRIIDVKFNLSADEFYANHQMTLGKQGCKISYSKELFKKIYKAAYDNDAGITIYAIDSENNIHAALFVIWDKVSAYDLISTIDPDFRNSGAASLLVKEIIRLVSTKVNKFDFEGSMIEGVEQSFRNFGAIQKPYLNVSKNQSIILKSALFSRDLLKR